MPSRHKATGSDNLATKASSDHLANGTIPHAEDEAQGEEKENTRNESRDEPEGESQDDKKNGLPAQAKPEAKPKLEMEALRKDSDGEEEPTPNRRDKAPERKEKGSRNSKKAPTPPDKGTTLAGKQQREIPASVKAGKVTEKGEPAPGKTDTAGNKELSMVPSSFSKDGEQRKAEMLAVAERHAALKMMPILNLLREAEDKKHKGHRRAAERDLEKIVFRLESLLKHYAGTKAAVEAKKVLKRVKKLLKSLSG
jgi:hypothetical protein